MRFNSSALQKLNKGGLMKTILLLLISILLVNCAQKNDYQLPIEPVVLEMNHPDPNYVDTCTEAYPSSNSDQDTLVIGDSISLGYTPYIQSIIPNVIHSPCNAGHSYWGVNTIDKYLAARPSFKAITFNFGIWDAFYGNSMKVEDYTKNLRYIATQIKKKTKNPYFVTTTYVSMADKNRMRDFNNASLSVMKEMEIPVIDIYSITESNPGLFGDDGFHLSQQGYYETSKIITNVILNK